MKIGIDYDGVITDACEVVYSINNIYNTNFKPSNVTDYDFSKCLGIEIDWSKELLFNALRNLNWRSNAKDIIKKLNQEHEVYIITARNPNSKETTDNKIYEEVGTKLNSIFLGHASKSETINNLNLDIMIEDSPDNIMQIQQYCPNTKIIKMNAPYNTFVKSNCDVDTWLEIDSYISNLKEEE
jgi:hypothetical protein